jgi:NADH:ubiquinone oxidoreductase subunit K
MLVNQFLILAAVLFCIGVYGVIARKNAVLVLMSIELILNSVNINLLAFSMRNGSLVGVGLAMVLLMYRNRRSIDLDELSEMKG